MQSCTRFCTLQVLVNLPTRAGEAPIHGTSAPKSDISVAEENVIYITTPFYYWSEDQDSLEKPFKKKNGSPFQGISFFSYELFTRDVFTLAAQFIQKVSPCGPRLIYQLCVRYSSLELQALKPLFACTNTALLLTMVAATKDPGAGHDPVWSIRCFCNTGQLV